MREHGDGAKLLAGGQSLVPAMNFRMVQPGLLVDLNGVRELDFVRQDGENLHIGAMTRERRLELEPAISDKAPLLSEAIRYVAHPQIRNRGTLGGSLANADPAAELPVIMVALEAYFRICSSNGERRVEARDFFLGMFATDLSAEEILVEVELPALPTGTGWSFQEVAPRRGDYALMGVAALVSQDSEGLIKDARLVFLNAGEGPVEARQAADLLKGSLPGDTIFAEAARLASQDEISPLGNVHASPEFQRHLANVLAQRALEQAASRAAEARPR